MRCFQVNFSTSLDEISHNGLALIHLVKKSTMTNRNLTALGAFGKGPKMSIPHIVKGQGELGLWRLLREVCGTSINSWHRLHLLVKSKMLALSVGQ